MKDLVRGVAAGVALQVALGAPFLLAHPLSYLERAFDFSRVRAAPKPGSVQPRETHRYYPFVFLGCRSF